MNKELRIRFKGFTLLETIVAIAVLTLAFLGPLAVATSLLSRSSFSSNQVIAYNLAEEGMEFIINKRDSLIFENPANGWDNFRSQVSGSAGCQSENGCYIDIITKAINGCGGTPPVLRKDSSTGVYSYDSSDSATVFKRCIFIPAGNTQEKQVRGIVKWEEKGGGERSFTLERYVYNRE